MFIVPVNRVGRYNMYKYINVKGKEKGDYIPLIPPVTSICDAVPAILDESFNIKII